MNTFSSQRIITAPPAVVFNTFRDPVLLAQWWGPDGFTSTFTHFDFREDGRWLFVMHGPDGTDYPNQSSFVEIKEPGRIVHDVEPFFTLTVELLAHSPGTRVNWIQVFDDEQVARNMAAMLGPANQQVLDRLQAVATGQPLQK